MIRLVAGLLMLSALAGCAQGRPLASTPASAAGAKALSAREQTEVSLGLRLFFDVKLSRTNRVSCASCHNPKAGFADARAFSVGVEGRTGARNAPTVLTAKHSPMLFWDGRAESLEAQALGPIVNPVEMDQDLAALEQELAAVPVYQRLFQAAYGEQPTRRGVARALAAFERALEVGDSPYDRWLAGDDAALSDAAKRGQEIFSVRAHCGDCHKGANLMDGEFHNLGWGLERPEPDLGRFVVTQDPFDWGAFKTPTLRNVAETGPYFHDGRAATLEEVVEFYDQGGRPNQNLDEKMRPIGLTAEEKADLVAFLKALTGTTNFEALAREAARAGK